MPPKRRRSPSSSTDISPTRITRSRISIRHAAPPAPIILPGASNTSGGGPGRELPPVFAVGPPRTPGTATSRGSRASLPRSPTSLGTKFPSVAAAPRSLMPPPPPRKRPYRRSRTSDVSVSSKGGVVVAPPKMPRAVVPSSLAPSQVASQQHVPAVVNLQQLSRPAEESQNGWNASLKRSRHCRPSENGPIYHSTGELTPARSSAQCGPLFGFPPPPEDFGSRYVPMQSGVWPERDYPPLGTNNFNQYAQQHFNQPAQVMPLLHSPSIPYAHHGWNHTAPSRWAGFEHLQDSQITQTGASRSGSFLVPEYGSSGAQHAYHRTAKSNLEFQPFMRGQPNAFLYQTSQSEEQAALHFSQTAPIAPMYSNAYGPANIENMRPTYDVPEIGNSFQVQDDNDDDETYIPSQADGEDHWESQRTLTSRLRDKKRARRSAMNGAIAKHSRTRDRKNRLMWGQWVDDTIGPLLYENSVSTASNRVRMSRYNMNIQVHPKSLKPSKEGSDTKESRDLNRHINYLITKATPGTAQYRPSFERRWKAAEQAMEERNAFNRLDAQRYRNELANREGVRTREETIQDLSGARPADPRIMKDDTGYPKCGPCRADKSGGRNAKPGSKGYCDWESMKPCTRCKKLKRDCVISQVVDVKASKAEGDRREKDLAQREGRAPRKHRRIRNAALPSYFLTGRQMPRVKFPELDDSYDSRDLEDLDDLDNDDGDDDNDADYNDDDEASNGESTESYSQGFSRARRVGTRLKRPRSSGTPERPSKRRKGVLD